MAIKLYHAIGARSLRPLWALEEMELAYQLEIVPFPPRQDPAYLERNPLGTIPWFVDGDIGINESVAICQYIATRYGPSDMVVHETESDYGHALNWLTFGETSLTYPLSLVIHYGPRYQLYTPGSRQFPEVVDYYMDSFRTAFARIDEALMHQDFLAGNRFTIADISVGYNFRLLDMLELLHEVSPRLRAYWSRLTDRPAYQRILAIESVSATR